MVVLLKCHQLFNSNLAVILAQEAFSSFKIELCIHNNFNKKKLPGFCSHKSTGIVELLRFYMYSTSELYEYMKLWNLALLLLSLLEKLFLLKRQLLNIYT